MHRTFQGRVESSRTSKTRKQRDRHVLYENEETSNCALVRDSMIPTCFERTQGIPPMDAVERLNRFKEEYRIRERKQELYSGEVLSDRNSSVFPEVVRNTLKGKSCPGRLGGAQKV